MNWDFLKSRAFWSSIGPFVASLCILFEVSEAKTAAIVSVITAFAGFWGVTLTRASKGDGKSYAELQRDNKTVRDLLEQQRESLRRLRGQG